MKNRNKNHFFLFCFSLLPGAGEMYLGFMKHGISLMVVFWGIIAFCSWLYIGPFLFLLPVLCFYSFFHVHNLAKMPEDKFQAEPDNYLFGIDNLVSLNGVFRQFQTAIAVILILIGISALWSCLEELLYLLMPNYLYEVLSRLTDLLPRLVIGIMVIALGIYFIHGRKAALQQDTSLIEERREENER